jgi:hypothetical protein
MAALPFCPAGPYYGFTEAELLAELDRYKAARKQAGSRISSVSVNGSSTSFSSVRADWSLDEWQNELAAALYLTNPDSYPKPPRSNGAVIR